VTGVVRTRARRVPAFFLSIAEKQSLLRFHHNDRAVPSLGARVKH